MQQLAEGAPRPVGGGRWSHLTTFGGLVVQLGLLAVVIRQFQIESSAFLTLALLAFAGFGVHYFLPLSARLPFFTLLSLSGIVLVMGATTGAVLIGLGLGLIGLCHLPFSYSVRAGLLIAMGGALAFLRTGVLTSPWSSALWPILGSMFMFRLMVYLYDLEHDKAPVSIWRTLGYFFVLPNVCFPLFPVIDFKTFRRTHFDRPAPEIYQVGIRWMVRGVTHLILYRVVYYYWTLSPSDVATARDLAQYLVSNFLLYLRVSGQFHLVIGMLHLFGFDLPETNHLYCLSASFTDFWRRINIYWKDFMMKVFYYPAYFRLRKLGETKSLVLATLVVFGVTWFLHSYQWFWLRSSFPIAWQDAAFWGILAALVVANSLYEMKHGRTRSLRTARPSSRTVFMTALKTIGTFAFIVTLWSLWTADTFSGWLSLWDVSVGVLDLGVLLAAAVLFGGIAALVFLFSGASKTPAAPAARWRAPLTSTVVLTALALAGLPQVYERLGAEGASLVVSLKSGKLSRRDMAALERGYYEDLLQVNRFDNQLWEVYMQKPAGFLDIQSTALIRYTGDFAQRELAPSMVSADSFSTVSTNRLGMRDREYEETPPPGAYRVSLLGASTGMGWGVEDGETYEALVEDRLNRELGGKSYEKYEILNHAVPGYYPLQQAVALEKALAYRPRAVLYEATGRELSRSVYYLSEVLSKGIDVPYPELRSIAEKVGAGPGLPLEETEKLLSPLREELVSWLYGHIVARCRAADVTPVWVFVPQTYQGSWQEETPRALALAEQSGFIVIDLSDIYEGKDREPLRLAEWDQHPNALGHSLIADGLYAGLRRNENALGLLADPKPHTSQ
jgi:hypothetical protein